MKLFYTIIVLVALSVSAAAQVKQQATQAAVDSAYNAKYTKFKALFLKYQLSDSHKNTRL